MQFICVDPNKAIVPGCSTKLTKGKIYGTDNLRYLTIVDDNHFDQFVNLAGFEYIDPQKQRMQDALTNIGNIVDGLASCDHDTIDAVLDEIRDMARLGLGERNDNNH